MQIPHEMSPQQMLEIKEQFVESTKRADRAGFDLIEFHAAHGYLISAFITPILNQRSDDYGGSLENRLRYPLEVFQAMRAVWAKSKPMSVRISAHDWMGEDGNTEEDGVQIAKAFIAAGADIVDVSSGQISHQAAPVTGRMFQTPLSDRIRNESDVATMAVGNIYEIDHVNSIVAAGRADLVCLARPHLADPNWTLRSAVEQAYSGQGAVEPHQYFLGYRQLEINHQRKMAMDVSN